MKNIILSITTIGFFFLFIQGVNSNRSINKTIDDNSINWMSWDEVQKAQQKEPKKVFVDVYTNWCGWCKRMDATTFSDKRLIKYLNDNFYSVKFNAEIQETISFKGKEYKFIENGRRGYNELAAELLNGRLSYPTTAYLDEDLNLLSAVPGYQQPESLDRILNYFGDDHYKTVSWEAFSENYKSPYN